jgi:cytochrome o ubiquinol oxidase subunit 2
MSRKNKFRLLVLLALGLVFAAILYFKDANFAVLQPAGIVGHKERNLILIALLLSIFVVVPVFIMLFAFAWKYREGNEKAKYHPEFSSSRRLESIWWGIPFAIIFILSIITWNSSHDLDPFKPLSAAGKPINIQVISMQWKWLFVYPDYNIASVNFMEIPTNTPVNFELTSDAPMNSFWIPQLGGQIYTMPGMSTHLSLMANKAGDYTGRSANISGSGFAHMTFTARASSMSDFKAWSSGISASGKALNLEAYSQLAKPGTLGHPLYYSNVDSTLYNTVMDKYLGPQGSSGHSHGGAL